MIKDKKREIDNLILDLLDKYIQVDYLFRNWNNGRTVSENVSKFTNLGFEVENIFLSLGKYDEMCDVEHLQDKDIPNENIIEGSFPKRTRTLVQIPGYGNLRVTKKLFEDLTGNIPNHLRYNLANYIEKNYNIKIDNFKISSGSSHPGLAIQDGVVISEIWDYSSIRREIKLNMIIS